jgi:MOSC domain-containing protein YiiM
MAKVVGLYTCAEAGEPMQAQADVHALARCGFAGDRYAANRGFFSKTTRQVIRHVSLIAHEAIDEANRELSRRGMLPFNPRETRRNVVTEGIDVNALVGWEFKIGEVRMRGIEPTRPCHRTSVLANKKGFAEMFSNRGGIRAEVLSDGIISVGDIVITQ